MFPELRAEKAVETLEDCVDSRSISSYERWKAANSLWDLGELRSIRSSADTLLAIRTTASILTSRELVYTIVPWERSRLEIAECDVLRDIFSVLFFPAALVDLAQVFSSDSVAKLAHSIYEDRAFNRLPIVADALEDAGCADPAILEHCRGPGPHVRGCWVIDLLLGKS
jgi:hypothetical protein